MVKIVIKPLFHRGQACIGIYFPPHPHVQSLIRKNLKAKWSNRNRCWYTIKNKEVYDRLINSFDAIATVEAVGLDEYHRQQGRENEQARFKYLPKANAIQKAESMRAQDFIAKLSAENRTALETYKRELVLKRYSSSTQRTYTNEFTQFLATIDKKPAFTFTSGRLKDYLQYCHNTLHLSANTIHSRMNALKFYFEQVLHREKFFWEIPRPKKPQQLPKVLGENEISRMFNAIENKKHKAILFTAYSAGLRVSEVTGLKISHVDPDRMQLFIGSAKGDKDRYVALSPIVLDVLRMYLKSCKPLPKVYLFEGPIAGEAYSSRSAQKIFQIAKERAGVQKEISFHGLRHSFATHLLEKGVDVKYIQEILGHFDIRTTMRYLHVRKDQLVNIASPIDDLYRKGRLDI